jgi:hypothetical protein
VGLFFAPPSFPWPFPWFSPIPEGCFPFTCCLVCCLPSCITDFSVVCFGFLAHPLSASTRDGLVSFLGRVGTEGSHSRRIDVLGVRTTLALHLRSSELMTPATTGPLLKVDPTACAIGPHSLSQLSSPLPSTLLSMPSALLPTARLRGDCVESFAWCQRPVHFKHARVGGALGCLRGASLSGIARYAISTLLPH